MPLRSDIEILSQQDTTRFRRGGGFDEVVEIRFMVGEDGPFTVSLQKSEFTAARVEQEVEKIAAQTRALRGK